MATKKIRPQSKRGTKAKDRPIPFQPVESQIRRAAERMNGAGNGPANDRVTYDRASILLCKSQLAKVKDLIVEAECVDAEVGNAMAFEALKLVHQTIADLEHLGESAGGAS